jgi:hypothetical protein
MKKINRKTPFLMMLVLSLVASQLFVRAFGINLTPSLGTLVHSWGRVASVVGLVYQPSFLAELDALSTHLLCNDKPITVDSQQSNGELACNKGNEFDFELPPAIEIKEPDYGEEPIKTCGLKSINKNWVLKDKDLDVEVLEMTADVEGDTPISEGRDEATTVVVLPPTATAAETSTDAPEAEVKAPTPVYENKLMMTGEEVPSAPKPEKLRKPCPSEQEHLRKEELRRLEESRRFIEEIKENCDIPSYQALQAARNFEGKSFEKMKRYRFIIKVAPQILPRSVINNLELVTGPDESEF